MEKWMNVFHHEMLWLKGPFYANVRLLSLLGNKYTLGNPNEYYRNAYCNKIIVALIVTYFLKAI